MSILDIAILISYYTKNSQYENAMKTKSEINLSIRKILEKENITLSSSPTTPAKQIG